MTLRVRDLEIPAMADQSDLKGYVSEKFSLSEGQLLGYKIRKKSLDARRKGRVVYHYQLDMEVADEEGLLKAYGDLERLDVVPEKHPLDGLGSVQLRHPPLIIGSGPSGAAAALLFAEAGQKVIVVERGEPVEKRIRTVTQLQRTGAFDPESHFCYGEGGAGTFSDGKLTCGRNHPWVQYLFKDWVKFGAPESILYDAHPHIGTDNLVRISQNQRKSLSSIGTEFLFGRRFIGLRKGDSTAKVVALFDDGLQIPTDHLILAIGHSARETYEMLLAQGVTMVQKPFAIGVRLEHPQDLINRIQFGNCSLPQAAEYKLAAHQGERGIWTFCMCPGGHLLPTGAQPGHLAINGMSYHARQSGFANAAVVVNILRQDYDQGHPLDGMRFQAHLETLAFKAGGSNGCAPAQKLEDFLSSRLSKGVLKTTYKPGVEWARIDRILPPYVTEALKGALKDYDKKMKGFLSPEASVIGVETKTSAPVVIQRDQNFQSVSFEGVYPIGEGGGFAGGIVSAALDGARVAQAILRSQYLNG